MRYEDILSFDTKLTADVVEWRPLVGDIKDYSNILACGTYFLDKEVNQRLGYLYLLKINENEKSLNVCNTLNFENSGILDMKWLNDKNLITIDSNNNLKLLYFEEQNLSIEILENFSLRKNETENSIGLTIDFSEQANNYQILTSDTLGYLNLINFDNQKLNLDRNFKGHDYEVWSVLIDKNDSNIIYSGADDCLLRMWDLRQSEYKKANECKIFEGGVCSIILPQRKNLECIPNYSTNNILCGSYDERIYVLDKRNMKRSVNQSNKLDGGVWKMKLHSNKNILLCACMHTGLHLVDTNDLKSELYYDKHGLNNLAYGCDWKPAVSDQNDIVASCSFYNHELRIWKLFYQNDEN